LRDDGAKHRELDGYCSGAASIVMSQRLVVQ
jgi:hypothetical protein